MARSAQYIDANGFLLIKGCPVSSPGIFDYSAAQVGETEAENHGALDRIVRVYRPAAAVQDPLFIESMKNVPLIDDHEYMIGDETVLDSSERGQIASPEEKGVEGVMTDNVYWAAPWLRADIKVFSRRMQAALRAGKRDLSLGYVSQFEYKPGVYEGQEYEYIQHHMRGNHVALVDQGRVPGARVLDGLVYDSMRFDVPSPSNPNPNTEPSPMDETLKQRLSALLPQLTALCGGGEAAAAPVEPAAAAAADTDVTEVAVDPAAAAPAAAAADPAAAPAAPAEADVLANIEAMLKQLLADQGAAEPELAAEVPAEEESAPPDTDGENTADSEEVVEVADTEHTVVVDSDETVEVEDTVEGILESNTDPKLTVDTADVPTASAGPKKGLNTEKPVGDAAFRSIMALAADRDRLASRLSKVVGTFDHSKMTPNEVAEYGCAKVGIKAKGTAARIALDSYLLGASRSAPKTSTTVVGDSASTHTPDFAAYLAGK